MAALTLTVDNYRDKIFGGWQGKSAGVTLGAPQRGRLVPGRDNYYNPVPGQPVASGALDFPLVWLAVLEECGSQVLPEDLAVGWLEHLDYSQDEFGYAALNLRRGLPPPASGAHGNWFRHSAGGVMRADFWAMVAPGAPQVAATYAYHDAKLDHSEEGIWAAMFLSALGSAAFFLTDPVMLVTIGLAMIPRTCRTARAVKAALAAGQRAAGWLEARESVLNEVPSTNFTDAPRCMGFFTIGLLYGFDFGASLCAAVNCGGDTETIGGAIGAILGIRAGGSGLPAEWTRPIGDVVIPGVGMRDFDTPTTITEVAERTLEIGRAVVAARCPDVAIVDSLPDPLPIADFGSAASQSEPDASEAAGQAEASVEPSVPDSAVEPVSQRGAETTEEDTIESVTDALAEAAAKTPVLPDTAPPPELPSLTVEGALASEAAQPEPDAAPGPVRPQAVSPEAPLPLPAPASPEAVAAAPVTAIAPDLVGAIAWADSTLVKPLLVTSPHALFWQAGPFEVVMDTGDSPTIAYNHPKTVSFSIVNRGATPFSGRLLLLAPPGWQIGEPAGLGQRQYIAAHQGTFRGDYTLRVPEGQGRIDIANAVTLRFTPDGGGAPVEAEFLLLGAACWWTVGVFANFDGDGFDRSYLPEDRPRLTEAYTDRMMRNVRWEKWSFPEPTLDLEPLFKGSAGVCYGQTILRSPTAREARLVANTNSGTKVWLNGALALRRFHRETFRPTLGSGPWAADVTLRAGDNPVMVKWVRGSEPYEFSLTVSDRFGRGLPEVGNTSW